MKAKPHVRGLLLMTLALAQVAMAQEVFPPVKRVKDTTPLVGVNMFGRTPRMHSYTSGWALTGSKTDAYEVRCEDVFTECSVPILRTKISADEPYGMGSITHTESAKDWRGRRVAVRAELRAGRIGGWAGLWMRIDGADGRVLAFDNMQNRALRGTSRYDWFTVVLDVPQDAEKISFGVMLHGPGAVFIQELQFEEVDPTVPVTDLMAPLRASATTSAGDGSF